MAGEWIKLVIHPEHKKIARLVELTGVEAERIFAMVVRWFRFVDQNCTSEVSGIGTAAFNSIVGWQPGGQGRGDSRLSLAEAMQDTDVG